MWKILAVMIAAPLAACTLDAAETVDELGASEPGAEVIATDDFDSYVVAAEGPDSLAASDCLTEEDCEFYPEQTYAQCVAACNGGVAAIERFCWLIRIPWVQASCLAMRFGGPVVCANWCYWYFTP